LNDDWATLQIFGNRLLDNGIQDGKLLKSAASCKKSRFACYNRSKHNSTNGEQMWLLRSCAIDAICNLQEMLAPNWDNFPKGNSQEDMERQ
jgi:hypothetical protein